MSLAPASRAPDPELPGRVLILTGTCGSGKTTISKLLALEKGWERVSEDDLWAGWFGKNRGAFGSDEYRRKRDRVLQAAFDAVAAALANGRSAVIDATVHESPPDSFVAYRAFFERRDIPWRLCVLHPSLEVAVARDAQRDGWTLGRERVASLRSKFTGAVFPPSAFLDTSLDTPEETLRRVVDPGA